MKAERKTALVETMRNPSEKAQLDLFILERKHRLMRRLGYLGEDARQTKDISHHGGFCLELASVNLHGPGDYQRDWQVYLKKISTNRPWTWGHID